MKIPTSVRVLYERQRDVAALLESRVQELFESDKHPDWFYKGRVKSLEAFAQKLETGRVVNPSDMEDLFACTIVVENRASIRNALDLVERYCEVLSRRPPNVGETHKPPESFPFDDLRLFVRLKPSELTPPTPLAQRRFEVQVKTFLQHAWSIATHDLIYKGSSVAWNRARVAFQIKAMLEHAEVSIEMVDEIATSAALAITDSHSRLIQSVLAWLESAWDPALLPADRVRLAQTLIDLSQSLKITTDEMIEAVRRDTDSGGGANSLNLSPYAATVQALIHHQEAAVRRFLGSQRVRGNGRMFIVPELEISADLIESARPERFVVPAAPGESKAGVELAGAAEPLGESGEE